MHFRVPTLRVRPSAFIASNRILGRELVSLAILSNTAKAAEAHSGFNTAIDIHFIYLLQV